MQTGRRKCGLLMTGIAVVVLLAGSGAVAADKVVVIPLKMPANSCTITHNGVCYGTVTSQGKTWLDRNLGDARVATSSVDEYAFGSLYQWGRGADGHESRTSATTLTQSPSDTPGHGDFIVGNTDWRSPKKGNLWQGVDGINNPCPAGFRLSTDTEWEAEKASWVTNNAAGAYDSPLKLVAAGYRYYGNGLVSSVGGDGNYWSGTVGGIGCRYLYFDGTNANMSSNYRAYGFSVRCLKD